jgi:hypothetical protein
MTFSIPPEDLPAFHGLPASVQKEVHETLACLSRIGADPRGARAAIAEESKRMGKARGWRPSSIRRKVSLYRNSGGNWALLVDVSRAPGWDPAARRFGKVHGEALPYEFEEYFRSLVDENHRKVRPAWRKLVRIWRAGGRVPGFGCWQEWYTAQRPGEPIPAECPPDLPDGWSYRSLSRRAPTPAERALTQRGVLAARQEIPTVIGTREGIRFLEWVVLDDFRCDFRVLDPRSPTPVQINGILALDVGAALALRFGLRPAIEREDGTEEGIKRRDTKAIIAGILGTYGYPDRYTMNLIVERGTATIPPDDAAAIEEITGGRVKVHYTQMISGNVFGFADRPMGNYLGKAWLESYFNLTHNEAADLPGQIGARYELAPLSTEARAREAEALVKAGQFLPPETRMALRFPFQTSEEARVSMEHIFRRLNARADHALEGFGEVMEWREQRLEKWRSAHEAIGLPVELQQMLLWRTRRESPKERAERLMRGESFTRVHHSCMPRLLEEHRRISIATAGEIRVRIRGRDRVYVDLSNEALRAGAEFLAYYDGEAPDWLHLTDGRGAYVSSVPAAKAVRRDDAARLAEEIRTRQAALNRTIAAVRRRNAGALQERAEAIAANEAILAGHLAAERPVNLIESEGGGVEGAPVFVRQIAAVGEARSAVAAARAEAAARVAASGGRAEDLLAGRGAPADLEDEDEGAAVEACGLRDLLS